ncbi:glycosyltransferase family 4 protein [Pluralibacter gergoviae]|uniref:glycosyltransferase family 4 protein n=1 Tax=Pluralibacter gergoviae TaxID=61647 RepID=UPI00155EC625|nr:glycosyltransferase family 4 protein [Pluralibacter gergoviae]
MMREQLKLVKNKENILLCGKIINLSEKLQQAKCLIAPFSFGTGIKIKIIEAMQYKTLVITNSIGAEGIPISSDIHFINCSTDEEYISNILKINSYNKMINLLPISHRLLIISSRKICR